MASAVLTHPLTGSSHLDEVMTRQYFLEARKLKKRCLNCRARPNAFHIVSYFPLWKSGLLMCSCGQYLGEWESEAPQLR